VAPEKIVATKFDAAGNRTLAPVCSYRAKAVCNRFGS
jgi:hypothetical protein